MNVLLLVILLWSLVEVHSQTAPNLTFMGENLPNHAFVNLSLVGTAYDGVQCHTDLSTCCGIAQGYDRGDWYFPNETRLGFNALNVVYEHRTAQRVDLRRNGNADMPAGIYRCDIETNAVNSDDNTDRETVYAGLYATGGKQTVLAIIIAPISAIFAGWRVAYDEANQVLSLCVCMNPNRPIQ